MEKTIAKIFNDVITVNTYDQGCVPQEYILNRFSNPEDFFATLARMKYAQSSIYANTCEEFYSDVINNRSYELTEHAIPQNDFYRILTVNEKNRVIAQNVIYLQPTAVLSLP